MLNTIFILIWDIMGIIIIWNLPLSNEYICSPQVAKFCVAYMITMFYGNVKVFFVFFKLCFEACASP